MQPAHRIALIALVGLFTAATAAVPTLSAKDWPHWRGTERLGLWTETGILEEFPDEGLTVKWRVPVNGGYSGPSVADGRVFVLDYVETEPRTMDGTERVLALDEESGEVLWSHEWPTTYRMLMFTYATGPRASPTVDGDRVYVVGSTGLVLCLNVETGAVIWEKDTVAEYDTNIPVWGTSSAPLIDGDRVILLVGGEPDALVMAFDKHTGDEVWRAIESRTEMGYHQPSIIEAGGTRQLIVWHPRGLSSLDPETGELYWEEEFRGRANMTVADAVHSGPYLFVSGFYSGSLMMRLDQDRPGATAIWHGENNRVSQSGVGGRKHGAPCGDDHAAHCRRLHLWHRQPWAGARPAGRDRRTAVGSGRTDHEKPVGVSVFHPARRPLFRLQRERRSDHRAVQHGGICRAGPNPPDESHLAVRVRRGQGRLARSRHPWPERPPRGLVAPGVRQPPPGIAER